MREAHVPIYFFSGSMHNEVNGFIVNRQNTLYLCTVYHAILHKLDALTKLGLETEPYKTLYVGFQNRNREPVRFQKKIYSEDIAHAKVQWHSIYGPGLPIQADAEKNDRLYLVGYLHNNLFSFPVRVVDRDEAEIEIVPIHKENYFSRGMSGSALIRHPNKEHGAVAVMKEIVADISSDYQLFSGKTGFAELL